MDINTEGLEQLIVAFTELIASFDIKALNFEGIEALLDKLHPILNPFWAFVNEILEARFGF